MSADSLVRPIKRIELIADQEGLFQIYLFELTSITIAHTRALARAFRNRAGNYLLVLASDYEHLDFVLLERYLPSGSANGSTLGQRQVGIRPHVLTIDRRKPSRLDLRVLRRLTWTESDAFAQYDKLLSAYAVADWSEEFFNNKQGLKPKPDSKADLIGRELVDALFDLKILDPAMGSGHFLVEAVDYITDKALDFLNAFPWNPVFAHLAQMRHTILQEMDDQGITIDPKRLTDVNLLKRHVLKRCVYEVDLNPMAVELAKVSLWLDCFTLGAPLSFLDHHLRCGNSLIGVTVKEVREGLEGRPGEPLQIDLFGSRFAGLLLATDLMRRVGELSDVTSAQVRESRAEYRRASDALAPFKRILDIYTSQWFADGAGTKRISSKSRKGASPSGQNNLVFAFLKDPEAEAFVNARDEEALKASLTALPPEFRTVAETALQVALEKRCLHWELEFPEVFYGPRPGTMQVIERLEDAGFDAIIGNPPYIDIKSLDQKSTDLLFQLFETVSNRANIYGAFMERALTLARYTGAIGMIVPNAWLTQSSYAPLKKRVFTLSHVRKLIRIPEKAFNEQKVETTVFCLSVRSPEPNSVVEYAGYPNDVIIESIDESTAPFHGRKLQTDVFLNPGALWTSGMNFDLLQKIKKSSIPLEKICEFCLGLTPYDKYKSHTEKQIKEEIFHATHRKDETFKPLLEGGDISRYSVEWNARWWIAYGNWLGAPREPHFFIQPRLLVKQVIDWTTRRLHVGYTEEELYNTQIAFNILGNGKYSLKFLITILNSVLLTWYHKYRFLDAVKQRFQKVLIQDAKSFPVRQIHFTTPDPERNKLSERLIVLYEKKQHENLVQMADQLLPRGNDGEFLAFKPGATGSEEKSDVIHDLLCHLADQMMNLNKQKESETRRFLSMLEKELKIQPDRNSNTGIDSFGGKTVIKGYLGDYQKSEDHLPYDALWEVLRKNGRRSGSTLDTAFEQRLKQEYEKSLALLLPIKEKLAATDWLIDQLVYRLYGLTEEEIAIVEGRE